MSIDWSEVRKALYPIRDYEDLSQRLRRSFAYAFVRETFDYTMPELASYTQRVLGEDSRGRYTEYAAALINVFSALHQAGIPRLQELIVRVETLEQLESLSAQSKIQAQDTVMALKYLVYWFIPMEKSLRGLMRSDSDLCDAVNVLRSIGVRTNLDLLQRGITAAGRRALVDSSGLLDSIIIALVHWADFSRLPWASKATISNIVGAGYGSLAALANADPVQLYTDFHRYGKSIGKNLKLGNEIESSHRIAKIVPLLVQEASQ